MGWVLELLLFGGAVGGLVYLATRPGGVPQWPTAPPQPTPPQAEIKNLAAQVAAETEKQQAVKVQLDNLTAAAAKAPPAVKQQLEAAKAQLAAAAAQGAEKQKVLKAQLVEKASAEVAAARKAEDKAAGGPMYPVGLDVRFGKRQATITEAHQDAQGAWHYTANVNSGEWRNIGGGVKQFSEAAVRAAVQKEVGPLQQGQAFAANVSVYRNGQGGEILKSEKNASGEWTYVIRNWGSPVTQRELMGILTR
jgi:hypothetical protein